MQDGQKFGTVFTNFPTKKYIYLHITFLTINHQLNLKILHERQSPTTTFHVLQQVCNTERERYIYIYQEKGWGGGDKANLPLILLQFFLLVSTCIPLSTAKSTLDPNLTSSARKEHPILQYITLSLNKITIQSQISNTRFLSFCFC